MKQTSVKMESVWGKKIDAEALQINVALGNDNQTIIYRVSAMEHGKEVVLESYENINMFCDGSVDWIVRFIAAQTAKLTGTK